MTLPREVLPGSTYLVTRRCTQRQFLLTPSEATNRLILYCLGVAAQQTGVLLHAICFMSNHWHGVLTDPSARLPEFLERFHRLLARAQNAALGRSENLWSSEKPSAVLLVSDQDVLDKMAYTIANPTAAGLVRTPSEWPGVVSHGLCESWEVERPGIFFDPRGRLPRAVVVSLVRPTIFVGLSKSSLAARLARAVQNLVDAAGQRLERLEQAFVGQRGVLNQEPTRTPAKPAERRRFKPRIAARILRARVDALRRLSDFVNAYRCALEKWRGGERAVLFPAGTYALRIYARVACAPACPL